MSSIQGWLDNNDGHKKHNRQIPAQHTAIKMPALYESRVHRQHMSARIKAKNMQYVDMDALQRFLAFKQDAELDALQLSCGLGSARAGMASRAFLNSVLLCRWVPLDGSGRRQKNCA